MKNLKTSIFFASLLIFNSSYVFGNCPEIKVGTKSQTFTMIEFGAKFCTGCFQMEKVMKKVQKELSNIVKVIFVDVDACSEIAEAFDIKLAPGQIFHDKNGKVFFKHTDVIEFEKIKELLKNETHL